MQPQPRAGLPPETHGSPWPEERRQAAASSARLDLDDKWNGSPDVASFDLCCAKRKHCFQGFVCHPIHELDLFFLNFLPPYLQRSNVGECMRIEQGVSSRSQICPEGGAMGRLLPVRKPNPLAADDVHERVSHGTKAAAQIARELVSAELGGRLQNPVVRPTVVFVQQLSVISSHGGGGSQTLPSAELYVAGSLRCSRRASPDDVILTMQCPCTC